LRLEGGGSGKGRMVYADTRRLVLQDGSMVSDSVEMKDWKEENYEKGIEINRASFGRI
jgi:hypothetical protein